MPTSDVFNIPPIVSLIGALKPRSVLDVGCGFGKYGVLLREYLDVYQERYHRDSWQTRLVALDGYASYRNPIWDYAYCEVHVGEAQQLLPTLGTFDVVLVADVIEHLFKPEARALVAQCMRQAPVVVISTPRDFYAQQASLGNAYEAHRCHWTAADCPDGFTNHTITGLACNIFVISRQPLDWASLYPVDLADVLYLRSRYRLRGAGVLGWPISSTLRWLVKRLA